MANKQTTRRRYMGAMVGRGDNYPGSQLTRHNMLAHSNALEGKQSTTSVVKCRTARESRRTQRLDAMAISRILSRQAERNTNNNNSNSNNHNNNNLNNNNINGST
ncbi:unnamed protein product [Polarella glacialis]|uniref:Uncharacterized protein n=1 Tax=Polarella glacialis TaxID=89957 RepID=A0A813EWL3_POLGL|nr:unnamed protein product [Polarella glacialis]